MAPATDGAPPPTFQGTLQKFVDDTFQAILSVNRPVPIAVKYLFDFLDELAEKHGIEDPETLHIWKTNRYIACCPSPSTDRTWSSRGTSSLPGSEQQRLIRNIGWEASAGFPATPSIDPHGCSPWNSGLGPRLTVCARLAMPHTRGRPVSPACCCGSG